MSANVETMFYVREKPWHGLGTRVEDAPTSKDALYLAGLDWRIEGRPVFDERGNQISGYKANTRDKDGKVMGIVSNRYTIVQNAEAFEFTDALIGEGVTYETAGSLKGGKQIWLLARLPEREILGDKFEPFICFTNTHDGTGAVRACMTPIRVVCNNTLNAALAQAERTWSTPHRGDVQGRIAEAKKTLLMADNYLDALENAADALANAPMSDADVEYTLDAMFALPEDATERQKTNAQRAKDGIMVCMLAPDLIQFLHTKWGFLNAVSDYVGHAEPMRKTQNFDENRWKNIIAGHRIFDKAVAMVTV